MEDSPHDPPNLDHFHPFGQWLLHNHFVPADSRDWMEKASYSVSGLKKLRQSWEHTETMDEFIDSLPGLTHTRVTDDETAIYQYRHRGLVGFTWVPAWGWPAYERVTHLQLDGSFGTEPYTYCVPQGIYKNEAVPLGFSMNVSESSLLFSWFFDDLESVHDQGVPFSKKPVLSDQGPGVTKFCNDPPKCPQFFCHHHLEKNAGTRSHNGRVKIDALRVKSERAYREQRQHFVDLAQALVDAKMITEAECADVISFIPEDPDEFVHGLWHRILLGISSCDNHSEGFHSVIEKALIKYWRSLLPVRLRAIFNCIVKKFKSFGNHRRDQVGRACQRLKKLKARQSDTCDLPDCQDFRAIMQSRVGLSTFPCKHTVLSWKPNPAEFRMEPIIATENFPDVHKCTPVEHEFAQKFLKTVVNPSAGPPPNVPFVDDLYDVAILAEGKSEAEDPRFAAEARDKTAVYRVVYAVLKLRNKKIHPQAFKSFDLYIDVWADLRMAIQSAPPGVDREKLIAEREVMWWKWSRDGGDRPIGPHTLGPEPTPEAAQKTAPKSRVGRAAQTQAKLVHTARIASNPADITCPAQPAHVSMAPDGRSNSRGVPTKSASRPQTSATPPAPTPIPSLHDICLCNCPPQTTNQIVDGLVGIQNLGASCYFNACMQCFVHLAPLSSYIQSAECDAHVSAPLRTDTKGIRKEHTGAVSKYRELQHALLHQETMSNEFISEAIRLLMSNIENAPATNDANGGQTRQSAPAVHPNLPGQSVDGGADLPEAVSTFLRKIHDDLNVMRPDRDFSEFDLSDPASAAWVDFLSTDESIVVSLFWGLVRQQTRCTSCQHTIDVVQPCEMFTVCLPPAPRPPDFLDIEQCISFTTDWTIFKEMGECPCSAGQEILRESKTTFVKLPLVLIIQLVRFEDDPQLSTPQARVVKKNDTPVQFDDYLDMSPWVEDLPSVGTCKYELHAVLQHLGRYGGKHNHYVSCVRTATGWYHFNDATVYARDSTPNSDSLHRMTPYALVYVQSQ
jgi:ubiquitin C-terminal hydrolase